MNFRYPVELNKIPLRLLAQVEEEQKRDIERVLFDNEVLMPSSSLRQETKT